MDSEALTASWQKYLTAHHFFNECAADLEREVIGAAIDACDEARSLMQHQTGLYPVPENLGAFLDLWKIKLTESTAPHAGMFGEYIRRQKEIILYIDVIKKYFNIFLINGFDLKAVCLAHELFHAVEARYFGDVKKLIVRRVNGNVKKHSRAFRQVSEIAAHTFAQSVFNMQEIPVVLLEKKSGSTAVK